MSSSVSTDLFTDISTKSTWAGALIGALGWLLSNQGIGLISILIALAGFLTNRHYKKKADRRQRELYELQKLYIQNRISDPAITGPMELPDKPP